MSFETAKWIWTTDTDSVNEYGEFFCRFSTDTRHTVCRVSVDGDYTLFVNGEFVASNQYGDFEHYKIYDELDISGYLQKGENEMFLLVWHFGENTQRYKLASAGAIFEVEQGGKILASSSKETLCRKSETYLCGYKKKITSQIGFSFLYDANKENCGDWHPAVEVEKICDFYPRPIKKLSLLPPKEITVLKNEGNYYLIDLGEETVGLPALDLVSQTQQKITVAWGEDLQNEHVRRIIEERDFSFEYIAKKGENKYTNYMLRISGRYLELYSEQPIVLNYLGLIPQIYEVENKPFDAETSLDKRVYDVCVNTLKLSMMEHYVDTPWREQCLYAFDSRNQMLCGYRAFKDGNKDYARANLLLMGKDKREDGLLSICFPCGIDLTIPTFSLYYFMALKEYLEFTEDISLVEEVYPKLVSIIEVFVNNIKDGLVCTFEGAEYWNFYDWTDSLHGHTPQSYIKQPDLIINTLFISALENLRIMAKAAGKSFNYENLLEEIRANTHNAFYDKEAGAYTLWQGAKEFTVLGNALAVLVGIAKKPDELCEKIVNGSFSDSSFSMKCFKYDALLMTNKGKWESYVLGEIRREYGKMLDAGATSFWETDEGASAFNNAGSLCHGWSAIPVLYL